MSQLAIALLALSLAVGVLASILGRRLKLSDRAYSGAFLRYQYIEWWQRNALESTPCDPSRDLYIGLALVAQLQPSLEAFGVLLQRLERDPDASPSLRMAAGAFLAELQAPAPPWAIWDETTGRPRHSEEALRRATSALLHPDLHPKGGASGTPGTAQSNSL